MKTLLIGAVFIIASLPDGTLKLAKLEGWSWLTGFGEASRWLKTTLPHQDLMLGWINYALIAYAAALLLIALRHVRLSLFAWGTFFAVCSAFVLHLLAWAGVIVFTVGGFIADVVGTVLGAIAEFFTWLGTLLREGLVLPFAEMFTPLLNDWSWAGALLTYAAVLLVLYLSGRRWPWARATAIVLLWITLIAGAMLLLAWLLGLVPPVVWSTAGKVLAVVFLGLLGIFAVATIGALVIDQLTSWKHAGSGRRGVLMGAIAVGSTMAVLMLVGNIYDVYDLYPDSIKDFALSVVYSKEPKLDCAMTLLVVGLCAFGVLRNLGTMRSEPGPEAFQRSLIFTIMGMFTAGAIAAIDKATGDN